MSDNNKLKVFARITILKAREDSEGWFAEAAGHEGRKHFAFAGAGRMLANTAQVASDLLDRIEQLESALASERDHGVEAGATIEQVAKLAAKHRHGAERWADPLPVPEWVPVLEGIVTNADTSALAQHDAEALEELAVEINDSMGHDYFDMDGIADSWTMHRRKTFAAGATEVLRRLRTRAAKRRAEHNIPGDAI